MRDNAGNVLPLTAAGMLVLTGLVGGGVDMARAYKAERRLQAACDAGALAGRRAVSTNGFDAAAETQAETYFDANFDQDGQQTEATVFTAASSDNGNTIEGTASATLPTVIMRVFGFESLDLAVSCTASMGVGNSDVMFVLDNTGSMAWTPEGNNAWNVEDSRMFALRQAMMSFYDTVEASTAGTNARIRYGFVPYSSSVNVGGLLMALDSSFVSDTTTTSSREPVNWGPVVDTWTNAGTYTDPSNGQFTEYSGTRYTTLDACNSAKPADQTTWTTYDTDTEVNQTFDPARGTDGQMVTATGTQTYQRQADYECIYKGGNWSTRGYYINRQWITREITSWTYEARDPIPVTAYNATYSNWIWRSVTRNVSTFKTGNAQALVAASSGRTRWSTAATWDGCIQERQTTQAASFAFVSLLTGITPGGAIDLDIDAAPTGDDATKWQPLWPNVTFRRGTVLPSLSGQTSPAMGLTWSSGNTYCPAAAQTLEELDEDEFDLYVAGLSPTGSTYHDIGLLWGARLSSPTGIFADNVNDEPNNGGTVSRHLIFMTDGELAPSPSVNSAYGLEETDRRATTDGNVDTQRINHRARYLAICEAIKARGIRLWVIAFGTDLTADLETDADTPGDQGCSSPRSAFQADNAEELDQHFQEIANQVGELRITQ